MAPSRGRPGAAHPRGDPALETVIVDDDAHVRRQVRAVLEAAGIMVTAEGADGREAIAVSVKHRPDVALISATMRGLGGIAATREILERNPRQVIVLLTHIDEDELGWLGTDAGAAGFVCKDAELTSLPRVVRGAAAGEAAVSRVGLKQLVDRLRHLPGA